MKNTTDNRSPSNRLVAARPVTGPYWTPADDGSLWLNLLVECSEEGTSLLAGDGAGLGPVVVELESAGEERREQGGEKIPSPVWPGIWAVRFRVEKGRWRRCRITGVGWSTPDFGIPRHSAQALEGSAEAPSPRLLLVSDLQLKLLVTATVPAVIDLHERDPFDGVLYPGDLVEVPEDQDHWWGHSSGGAFFDLLSPPSRLGILAEPLFLPCPGNHDISATRGRTPLERLEGANQGDWSLRAYAHLFPLPRIPAATQRLRTERLGDGVGPSDYYAARVGDVWVCSLFVTRWYAKGDHHVRKGPTYELPGRWIFEQITRGSMQYEWLRGALASPACRSSRVRIVQLHHGIYSQGHSAVPPFGIPPDYEEDLLVRDLVPLLHEGGVDLVLNGHNHIVNHRIVDGIHYVESSHSGNTYAPYAQLPDGAWAAEPHGHPSRLIISEPGFGYFSVLETVGSGRMLTYRVDPTAGGSTSLVDEVEMDFTV